MTTPSPEIAGFTYVEDDAAYRITCLACGETAGTLGYSRDYAYGWLDAWADHHSCADCNHTRSVVFVPHEGEKWCADCRALLSLSESEKQSARLLPDEMCRVLRAMAVPLRGEWWAPAYADIAEATADALEQMTNHIHDLSGQGDGWWKCNSCDYRTTTNLDQQLAAAEQREAELRAERDHLNHDYLLAEDKLQAAERVVEGVRRNLLMMPQRVKDDLAAYDAEGSARG